MASTSKEAEVDLDEIVINAVTTKSECHQKLQQDGVLDLFSELLRELYEADESNWPKKPKEYLLFRFLQRIPIVKQMRFMNKNFHKRIIELEDEAEEKKVNIKQDLIHERHKILLRIRMGREESVIEEIGEPEHIQTGAVVAPSSISVSRASLAQHSNN